MNACRFVESRHAVTSVRKEPEPTAAKGLKPRERVMAALQSGLRRFDALLRKLAD
jgi:hypothetical protein